MKVWIVIYNSKDYADDDKIVFKDKESAFEQAKKHLLRDLECSRIEVSLIDFSEKDYSFKGYDHGIFGGYYEVRCKEVEVC